MLESFEHNYTVFVIQDWKHFSSIYIKNLFLFDFDNFRYIDIWKWLRIDFKKHI